MNRLGTLGSCVMDYTDLGAMVTATFNAIYAGDSDIEPAECLADIEQEGLPELVRQ